MQHDGAPLTTLTTIALIGFINIALCRSSSAHSRKMYVYCGVLNMDSIGVEPQSERCCEMLRSFLAHLPQIRPSHIHISECSQRLHWLYCHTDEAVACQSDRATSVPHCCHRYACTLVYRVDGLTSSSLHSVSYLLAFYSLRARPHNSLREFAVESSRFGVSSHTFSTSGVLGSTRAALGEATLEGSGSTTIGCVINPQGLVWKAPSLAHFLAIHFPSHDAALLFLADRFGLPFQRLGACAPTRNNAATYFDTLIANLAIDETALCNTETVCHSTRCAFFSVLRNGMHVDFTEAFHVTESILSHMDWSVLPSVAPRPWTAFGALQALLTPSALGMLGLPLSSVTPTTEEEELHVPTHSWHNLLFVIELEGHSFSGKALATMLRGCLAKLLAEYPDCFLDDTQTTLKDRVRSLLPSIADPIVAIASRSQDPAVASEISACLTGSHGSHHYPPQDMQADLLNVLLQYCRSS